MTESSLHEKVFNLAQQAMRSQAKLQAVQRLCDKWEAEDHVEPGSYFADQLREVLDR